MELAELEKTILEKERARGTVMSVLMRKVYIWMSLALVITGITAYGVATSPNILVALYSHKFVLWGILIAEFAIVLGISAAINRLSLTSATLLFILYSVLNGIVFSSIFMIYTYTSIAKVFFITAGTFAVMAVYGSTTKRDLTRVGSLLFMALIGLVIALVVNIFLKSAVFDYVLSFIGVAIFVGLTAYDSQKIKRTMLMADDVSETMLKYALLGALSLYLDFINLFLFLLRIFGSSDN